MEIIEIKENKKQFLPLLLLADEQESMIDRYIDRGTMYVSVSYTHLRAHETRHDLVCRLLLEKKKTTSPRDGLLTRMPSSA